MPDLTCAGLTDRALLRIGGPEAVPFLNALVSNSVDRVAPGRAVYAALLSPQGKFLHDFLVAAAPGPEAGLLLDVAAGRRADLKRRLTLYRLRSKVEIADADWQGFALFGGDAAPAAPEGGVLFADPRLPALGWRLWLPPGTECAIGRPGSPEDYERHRLALGVPDGARDIEIDKGLLLENHFEALNGIDFRKGCYIGQELTARTKYRGLVKKQLYRVMAAGGKTLPPAGTPVTLEGREAGELRSSLGNTGLALLRLDAVAAAGRDGRKPEAAGLALLPQRPEYAPPLPEPENEKT